MNRPYSEATVEAVAAAIAAARDDDVFSDSEWNGSHWEGNRDQYRGDARAALDALAAAGLLLPEGAETRTEWGLTRADREAVTPYKSRLQAERWLWWSEPGWELVCREAATTPWRPVDAVRLAEGDNKESQDHAEESRS